MIKDKEEAKQFATDCDNIRHASSDYITRLRSQFEIVGKRENSRGIELGCGTGNYTIPMIDTFKEVWGLDVSEEMLSVARGKVGADHVQWIEQSALRGTKVPTDYFDGVWGVSMLHYFRKAQQKMLFEQIHRILRPGGKVILDIEFEEQHGSFWQVEFFPSLRKRYEGRILSCDQYRSWLKEIGFKTVEFEHFDLPPGDLDKSARCGQHRPELYLNEKTISVIPAFREMDLAERLEGQASLRRAIANRSIDKVIANYVASMPGNFGVIIGERE
jgi:ubiquinone/menaquinone biosynthesis C-methylase UbiE